MEIWEDKYKTSSYAQLAIHYRQLQGEKDNLEKQLAEVNKEFDYLRKTVLPERLEVDGLQNVTVAGVGRFGARADLYISTPAEERFTLQSWLAERGCESLIQPTVNSSTLKAFIKERMEHGDEVPPMVKITPYTMVTLTSVS